MKAYLAFKHTYQTILSVLRAARTPQSRRSRAIREELNGLHVQRRKWGWSIFSYSFIKSFNFYYVLFLSYIYAPWSTHQICLVNILLQYAATASPLARNLNFPWIIHHPSILPFIIPDKVFRDSGSMMHRSTILQAAILSSDILWFLFLVLCVEKNGKLRC